MCVLLHLLICTALRAHIIIVDEALYKILSLLLLLVSMQYFLWTTNCILLRAYAPVFRSWDTDKQTTAILFTSSVFELHQFIKGSTIIINASELTSILVQVIPRCQVTTNT